jgi:hypothetical protein
MIVNTSPLRIPRTSRRSLSTATTLYCSSKIDVSVSFIWTVGCAMSYQRCSFSLADTDEKRVLNNRNKPLAVGCPTCGAEPGEKCEFSTGLPRTEPHRDRRLTASEKSGCRRVSPIPPSADADNVILVEPRIARNEAYTNLYTHLSAILRRRSSA